jgi:phage protein U
MELGSFGRFVFETGVHGVGAKIRTWQQFKRKGVARFAEHNVLGAKPKLEFEGAGLEEIDIKVKLDVQLGLNPKEEIDILRAIRNAGKEQALIIAGKSLGKFVLFSTEEDWLVTDNRGNLLRADVTMKLKEYDGS